MRTVSYFFFFTYVGLVIFAGFWGAFINPAFDQKLLYRLNVDSLTDYTRINLLSQYRFLRALELGFGLFSIIFIRQIFSEFKFNRLFLGIMSMGVLARIFSIVFDGGPGFAAYVFMFWELSGLLFIFFYTHKNLKSNAGE